MDDFFDDLIMIHNACVNPPDGKGFSIMIQIRGKKSWVSGIPYDHTSFSERAFVFPTEESAREFARKHVKSPHKIHRWPV